MRRLALTLAALASILVAAAAPVAAHELQLVPPGPAELDVGTADPARLLHATLLEPADRLQVGVLASTGPVEALLLVPDREPERGRAAAAAPTIRVDGAARSRVEVLDTHEEVRDEATGFEYLVLATVAIPRSDEPASVVVTRGAEPTRIALRVGPTDAPFTSTDPERTPRALILTRGWIETEPAGAADLPAPNRSEPDRSVAWFGLALAAAGILVAIWWVARGRATSRRRGVERAPGTGEGDESAG